MRFFQRKYSDPEEVLRDAPGPSPWYLRANPPKLSGMTWESASDNNELTAGKILLKNSNNEVVAIVDMYCYVLAVEHRYLFWYQGYVNEGHLTTIDFLVLDTNKLPSITDIPKAFRKLKEEKLYIFHAGESVTPFLLPTDKGSGKHLIDFPQRLKIFDELLVLGHSTSDEIKIKSTPNLCIFILRPKMNEMEIVPQDWFNNGNLDYGYHWVTRVARDPKSGKIYGEGFRISSFALDDSLREVEKWFHDDPFFKA